MRPYLIVIAGGSGSGKTYFAGHLMASLGKDRSILLCHDLYYRDLSHLPPSARGQVDFDDPAQLETSLLVEHLDLLKKGEAIQIPQYNFTTHCRREGTRQVEPRPFILLEGVLVLAEAEIRSRADLRIFVDSPEEVRLQRRLQRDLSERGRTRESILRQWTDTVLPMHRRFVGPSRQMAHLVVRSDSDLPGIAVLLARGLLGAKSPFIPHT
jgi:uridine kinase